MTNRKLKKKIRQAFEHATPDLAESIAVSSLLSDISPRKGDKKEAKPIHTPIQFRALATLAACIAVVALLASIVSMLNPFGPNNTTMEPLATNPSTDEAPDIGILYPISPDSTFPGFSSAELQEIKEYLFTNAEIPFEMDNTAIHVTSDSWNGTVYQTVTLSEANGEQDRQLSFFLEKGKETTIYPFDPNVDVSKYMDQYLDMSDKDDSFFHQVVLADSRVCYALVSDYGVTGKFVLIDAETESVVENKTLTGSVRVLSQLAQDHGFTAVSFRDYDCMLKFMDGRPCYEIYYRLPISLYALYDAASHRFIKITYTTTATDPTDPLNTEGPEPTGTEPTLSYISSLDALQIARDHAGVKMSELKDYLIHDYRDSVLPYYEVILYTDEFKYVYQIEAIYCNILKIDRYYAPELGDADLSAVVIEKDEALQIATQDPFIRLNTGVDSTSLKTEGGVSFYTVYLTDNIYWYRLDVSSALGIVLNAQIANRNYYLNIDDKYYISTIYPTPGKDPNEDFGGGFDSSPFVVNEMEALSLALNTAEIEQTDLIQLELTLDPAAAIPRYEIVFLTADYQYEFSIAVRNAVILRGERKYNHELNADEALNENHISQTDAELIARADTMMQVGYKLIATLDRTQEGNYYELAFESLNTHYQYTVRVSSLSGIVTNFRVNCSDATALREEILSVSNINPRPVAPNGMVGAYQALDIAIDSLGYTAENVSHAKCEVYGHGNADCYAINLTTGNIQWEVFVNMYTGQIETVTTSDGGITPPDGKIGMDNAIDAAMRYAGLTIDQVEALECSEGDDPNFAPHYDVAFYYDGYKWHCYIGMYNHRLLNIERIPIPHDE